MLTAVCLFGGGPLVHHAWFDKGSVAQWQSAGVAESRYAGGSEFESPPSPTYTVNEEPYEYTDPDHADRRGEAPEGAALPASPADTDTDADPAALPTVQESVGGPAEVESPVVAEVAVHEAVSAVSEGLAYGQSSDVRPVPEPVYASGVEQWRGLVSQYGNWDVDWVLRVMQCESGGNPRIVNAGGSGATGLMQIINYWNYDLLSRVVGYSVPQSVFEPEELKDPVINIATANLIYQRQGAQGWSC